jgi:hypothetical protein
MPPETLRISAQRTQSVLTGVTTQSVGTIDMLWVFGRTASAIAAVKAMRRLGVEEGR